MNKGMRSLSKIKLRDHVHKKVKTVGVLGGTFDPLHLGHIHLVDEVQKHFSFDIIKIVPAYISPLKSQLPEASTPVRVRWLQQVFKNKSFVEIDEREIKNKECSYTIATINNIAREFDDIFLIMGMDQLLYLDRWRQVKQILEKVNIIACSRKDYPWQKLNMPQTLRDLIKRFDSHKALLKTGKNIYYLDLKNVDISSSQVRELVAHSKPVSHLVPAQVSQGIKKNQLYSSKKQSLKLPKLVQFCAKTLLDKKAEKIKAFDFSQFSNTPFQFTLVASGQNTRHTKMLSTYLQIQIKKQFSVSAEHIEGQQTGQWIVLDYTDLIVHIFYDYTREYYQIEDLWKKAIAYCPS